MLFLTKLPNARISDFAAGISLVNRTGYSLPDLIAKATKDRIALGRMFLGDAETAANSNPPQFRSAVSRAYYSMYHTIRAVVFYTNLGDDYEKHSELPKHIPTDFPSFQSWSNTLKNARLERNKADYNPYPKRDDSLQTTAAQLLTEARALLPVTRHYLRRKGLNF